MELIKSYEAGRSVRDLAQQYRIHRTTVLAHLERNGIRRRPHIPKLIDQQTEEAARLYESGLSPKKVGDRFQADSSRSSVGTTPTTFRLNQNIDPND